VCEQDKEPRYYNELGGKLKYNNNNKQHYLEYNKQQHYNDNKEHYQQQKTNIAKKKKCIYEQQNKKHVCSSGGCFTNAHKIQHLNTKKHQKYIQAQKYVIISDGLKII
jgi:hypothetical protein